MISKRKISSLFLLCGMIGFLMNNARPRGALAHTVVQQPSPAQAEPSSAQKYFTDVELLNQNGQKMRLYSDLLKDKVVVINSFFSTCQASCVTLIRNMQKLQTALGNKVGTEVHLISISVDPTVDTPERLKEFATKNSAKSGWYFITGDKVNVDFALKKLGQYVDKKEDHLNIIIIANERTGLWKKAFGLAPSDELLKVVESVLNDR